MFDPAHELSDDDVATLLHAAQWAPSWGNTQPWRFVVLRRGRPGHDVLVRHLTEGNSGWVPRASAVFVAGTDPSAEADYARYDLGQAAAHLTLQARAMGLHAHQFAGFDHEATAAGLGIPDDVLVLSGIAVGVLGDPATAAAADVERNTRVRKRKDLTEFAFEGRWGQGWTAP